ncbi:hypothetical protein HZF05_14580 [Sphingomonas sp. CGMCC 1.13654]|uniref:Uncharacterized protein n=1 Tax=Sphingomonas chungangi TaxID=2683589 RepID=A0A838L7L5_9SPHN|nr:hypothetical protein [Sphingomonas chungangi]MBA2935311.1 hypothetical protein [Sphingomonas chungangi]MVW56818.1 hypothetical protein [Sphingomonas chungangi]
MLSIRSSADMARALASPLDAELLRLLALRRDQLTEYEGYDLGDLAHFIIVQPGDTLAAVETEAGWPISGEEAGFEWVQHHAGWHEAVLILSDDGFGVSLWVPDSLDIDPALLALVRDHA